MKSKVIAVTAIVSLALSSFAFGAAQDADWLDRSDDGSVTIAASVSPTLTIKPSANVFFGWGVETAGTAYSIGTIHTSGTFTYATTSTDTNIYRFENETNANPSTDLKVYTGTAQLPPASPDSATDVIAWGAGWTASK